MLTPYYSTSSNPLLTQSWVSSGLAWSLIFMGRWNFSKLTKAYALVIYKCNFIELEIFCWWHWIILDNLSHSLYAGQKRPFYYPFHGILRGKWSILPLQHAVISTNMDFLSDFSMNWKWIEIECRTSISAMYD